MNNYKYFLTLLLSCLIISCFAQTKKIEKKANSENVMETSKETGLIFDGSTKYIFTRIDGKEIIEKIRDWYQWETPVYRPISQKVSIESLERLQQMGSVEAEKIKSMCICLDEEIDSSAMSNIIPLKKFKNLEYLQINNNKYAPFNFDGLDKLRTLRLYYVYDLLEIPMSIGKLKELEYLIIAGANDITHLPEEIFLLTELKTLELTGLSFRGDTLSRNIKNLKNLKYLDISTCSINLPLELGELKELEELRISNFSYSTPYQAIYKLPKLKTLKLNISREKDLNGIHNLQSLEVLNLQSPFITSELGALANLKGLIIGGFNGKEYPSELRNLKKLEALRIGANFGLVNAPDFIPELKNLKYLELRGCNQLKNFGSSYRNLKDIELIEIFYNDLINTVPENLKHIQDKVKIEAP